MVPSIPSIAMHEVPLRIAALFLLSLAPLVGQHEPIHGPRAAHYRVRATTTQPVEPTAADLAAGVVAPEAGLMPLEVTLTFTSPEPGRTVFEIPLWTPGSYRTRRFPERITAVRARSGDENLEVERISNTAWEVTHGRVDEVTLDYTVLLAPDDRFMYRGDSRRCLTCEGPAIYMYVRGHEAAPCWVTWDLPEDWQAWSGLVRLTDGRDFAASYDVLADCPVKLGVVDAYSYESRGTHFDVIVDSAGDREPPIEAWIANIQKITEAAADVFGGTYPVNRYVFLFTVGPGSGGGLEHSNSTCIGMGQISSPTSGLSTIAHEFFHTWNVKRIRAVELGPFDYSRRVRTPGLWIAEGFTTYYTSVVMARAGLLSDERFWRNMGSAVSRFESTTARHHVSSNEASEEVWSNHAPDRNLNYYNSGQVLGFLLDLELRTRTDNRVGLDHFMRGLWHLCLQQGRGYERHEPALVASVLTGQDMRPWFDRYADGTAVPDYEGLCAKAGIAADVRTGQTKALRGVIAGRGGLFFGDYEQLDKLDTYGDIDPFNAGGALRTVHGQAVESAEQLEEVLRAQPAGARLRVTYESAIGREVAAMAVVELRPDRARIALSVDENAPPGAAAIRESITAPR